ncbi:chorismate-binding protein [uncultured Kordia sp.]|uniref:chorismate-binding protein n=1 Tax=uncultured Kordia sp. TaxID=507699 RepID=UPI0026215734|nr:chorismate-binding protein [uncultured Kordia sp.]
MLETLATHLKNKLPFVAYRKPNAILTNVIFQHDDLLHKVSDFTESGFVFAPFDATEKAILIPFEDIQQITISDISIPEATIVSEHISAKAHQKHIKLVAKGVETIQNSEIEKIVLSHKEEVVTEKDPLVLFQQLLATYKTAFVYIWYHPKVGMWLGATPETLVKSKGSTFTTMSLAGTRKLEKDIVVSWDQKEIDEQQIVTDYIVNRLQNVTSNINITKAETHQAGSIVHLRSMISGRISSSVNIGDIITTLHPTPAICGFPTQEAKSFILKEEGYNRTFYTGYLGELNMREENSRNRNRKNQENSAYRTVRTNSELYVNLRCMELNGRKAILYIGGGIVKDSNPESEWQETLAKSQIMKRVL